MDIRDHRALGATVALAVPVLLDTQMRVPFEPVAAVAAVALGLALLDSRNVTAQGVALGAGVAAVGLYYINKRDDLQAWMADQKGKP